MFEGVRRERKTGFLFRTRNGKPLGVVHASFAATFTRR